MRGEGKGRMVGAEGRALGAGVGGGSRVHGLSEWGVWREREPCSSWTARGVWMVPRAYRSHDVARLFRL